MDHTTLLPPPWLIYFATLAAFAVMGATLGAVAGRSGVDSPPALTCAATFLCVAFAAFTPVWVLWQITYWLVG